jgi:hypothetical protein
MATPCIILTKRTLGKGGEGHGRNPWLNARVNLYSEISKWPWEGT